MTIQKQEITKTEQIDFIGYMDVQHHINRIGVEPAQAECPICVREERDRYRKALEEITEHNWFGPQYDIAKKALEGK